MPNSDLFSLAPMMDCTDRHFRYLIRLISGQMLLYTEMIHTGAILFGDRHRFLQFDESEHPLAIQLGGCDPKAYADCAPIIQDYGYDEINLNIGCPSPRVTVGSFGACLMAQPDLVARCIDAIKSKVDIPVTVKTRVGIDLHDSYEFLTDFIQRVAATGCNKFIVHARKAWLKGLSPKQNREIPPLQYEKVYRLKKDFPELTIIINGGLQQPASAHKQLTHVDGVMVGRALYHNPYDFIGVDPLFFNTKPPCTDRKEILEKYCTYIETQLSQDVYLKHMARHLLNFFHGQNGAKNWRRDLSTNMHKPKAGIEVVTQALSQVV